MFPLNDLNPTIHKPWATVLIILVTLFVWFVVQDFGIHPGLVQSICKFGLIPGELLQSATPIPGGCPFDSQPHWSTLLTSMFMHGSWFHIIGNLWFLWVFGDNVEDIMGPVRFIVFYLLCGFAAAAAQMFTSIDSVVPMVGASGAIGGVMGAYAFLYPRARVNTLIFLGFYITTVEVPALFMLGYWFLIQLLSGLPTLLHDSGAGVAFWAHVGGFLAGLALIGVFSRPDYLAAHRAYTQPRVSRHRWF